MLKKLLIAGLLVITAAFAAEGFKVTSKIKIGGTGGWDYVPSTRTRIAFTRPMAHWWKS